MSNSRKFPIFLVSAFIVGPLAHGAYKSTPQQSTSAHNRESIVNKRIAAGASCHIDFEEGEIPNCLYQTDAGQLFIAPEFVKKFHFKSYGLAGVFSEKQGWMYVNRKGIVVVQGVVSEDNGPAPFYDRLVLVVRNAKYGFANRKGQLVIPAIYDGAGNFVAGKAEVCKGYESKCMDRDCEHGFFLAESGFKSTPMELLFAYSMTIRM